MELQKNYLKEFMNRIPKFVESVKLKKEDLDKILADNKFLNENRERQKKKLEANVRENQKVKNELDAIKGRLNTAANFTNPPCFRHIRPRFGCVA